MACLSPTEGVVRGDAVRQGQTHTFDSFQRAVHALAPTCPHCGVRIVRHGVEQVGDIYCCANCAQEEGASRLQDRA